MAKKTIKLIEILRDFEDRITPGGANRLDQENPLDLGGYSLVGIGTLSATEIEGAGKTRRALNIPTTNLADTEEIRQWFVAPSTITSTVVASTLLNEAGNAPTGLDVVVYDYTAGAEVYRDGSTYNEPHLELTAGNVHYVAIENQSSATQNANAVLDMEVE